MQNNPTHLSISEVARVVGMSVQNLRKTYINKWKLSVSKDARWMPYVDLSECLRVFPDRFKDGTKTKQVSNQNDPIVDNPVDASFQELLSKNITLETDMQSMRERLQIAETRREQAESREQWLRDHVDKLADQNQKLLSAPQQQKSSWLKRVFWS